MNATIYKFPYAYMDYENIMLLREIKAFFPNAGYIENGESIIINGLNNDAFGKLPLLTYASNYEIDGTIYFTLQHRFENGHAGTRSEMSKKQSTRYSTHGLHEYKGKYNPQIVRSIMNIAGLNKESFILDPFCGSGTTMLECQHVGVSAVGTDINPFAVYVSNVKLKSIYLDYESTLNKFYEIRELIETKTSKDLSSTSEQKRYEYLKKWIPKHELNILEMLLDVTKEMDINKANFFKITASDLIRDYSFQEPNDLRIRRRISPFPEMTFMDAWERNVKKYLHNISVIQEYFIGENVENVAVTLDIRDKDFTVNNKQFDAAITSPPYATALPYIDTQRISLVWLGLCKPESIMALETKLIGSREFYKKQKSEIYDELKNNSSFLPQSIYSLISDINNSLSSKDGFRKQAMPLLLYRYFRDMKKMFATVYSLVKKNGKYCLVVGHNKTTISDITFNIDTPTLLSTIAESCGWQTKELIPLQTYKRYGLNNKNSINHETLLILSK